MATHSGYPSTHLLSPPSRCRSRRSRFCALLVPLVLAVLATGCKVVILSGPTVIGDGETVVYTLELSDGSSGGGPVWVVADVPLGWSFVSAFFEGTEQGQPVSGMGMLSGFSPCTGDLQPGYQRFNIETPAINTDGNDLGTAEVTFDVGSQPSGPYPILFYFTGSQAGGSDCSAPAARTINPDGTAAMRFVETIGELRGPAPSLDGVLDLAVTADGSQLLVVSRFDDALTVMTRSSRGRLTLESEFVDGVDGVDGLDQPHTLALAPDNAHAYVASRGDAGIAIFERDSMSGEFSFSSAVFNGGGPPPPLAGLASLSVSPDGDNVYAAAQNVDSVVVFSRDVVSGALTSIQTLNDSTDPGALTEVSEVVASPDGSQVYTVSRADNEITVYDRSPATGMLSFAERVAGGGLSSPVFFEFLVMAPDGAQLYALGLNEIVHFDREADGSLTHVATQPRGMAARGPFSPRGNAVVTPAGRFFYTLDTSAVAVYARDPATGVLSFTSEHFQGDGEPPIDGFGSPLRVAVDPAGQNLYVTSSSTDGDTVAVLDLQVFFADGFETGDTSRWSSTLP